MPRRMTGAWRGQTWLVAAATAVATLVMAALAYARWIEPRRLQVARYRLGVRDLPPALEGARIAHLTDFHVGMPATRRSTLRRAIAVARAERPDVVALTGDFVDDGVWRPGATIFADLAASAPTFAVLGNHDRDAGPAATKRIVDGLRAQGVRVLRNEHVVVPVREGQGEVVVVAVDDPSLGYDDLTSAMAGLPPAAEAERPALLLGHAPDIVERAPPGRFAVTLAGHTHGGQLSLPLVRRRVAPTRGGYVQGLFREGAAHLYVSRGVGTAHLPVRLNAPPEIALITLRARPPRTGAR